MSSAAEIGGLSEDEQNENECEGNAQSMPVSVAPSRRETVSETEELSYLAKVRAE